MAEQQSDTIVLDLEEQLIHDEGGEAREQIKSRFHEEILSIDEKLRGGVSQETFSHLQTLKKGYECAARIVDDVWRMAHP